MEKKIPYIRYEEQHQKTLRLKSDRRIAQTLYNEKKAEVEPLEKKYKAAKEMFKEDDEIKIRSRADMTALLRQLDEQKRQIKDKEDKVDDLRQNIVNADAKREEKRQKIMSLNNEIASLEEDYESKKAQHEGAESSTSHAEFNKLNAELNDVDTEHKKVRAKLRRLELDGNRIQHEINNINENIKQLDNVREAKMKKLQSTSPDCYRGYEWIEKNRNKFHEDVVGPLMLEINVKDSRYENYVEDFIGMNNRLLFACFCEEDYKLFNRELNDRQKLRLTCVLISDNYVDTSKVLSQESLHNLGFDCFLEDVIDASEKVLQILRRAVYSHCIPLALREVNGLEVEKYEEVLRYGANGMIYNINRYQYDKSNVTVSNRKPKKADFFSASGSVDLEELAGLQEMLETTRARLDTNKEEAHGLFVQDQRYGQEKQKIEKKMEAVKDELQRSKERAMQLKSLKNQISLKKQNKRAMENEITAMESHDGKIGQIQKLSEERMTLLGKYHTTCVKFKKCTEKLVKSTFHYLYVSGSFRELELNYQTAVASLQEKEAMLNQIVEEYQRAKGETRRLYEIAHAEPLSEEENEAMKEFPNDVYELEALVSSEKALLNMQTENADSTAISRFEKLKEHMRDKEAEHREVQQKISQCRASIEALFGSWHPRVKALMASISERFAEYFSELGYDGEVGLEEKTDTFSEHDYDKYGIKIMVKFRENERLTQLTSTRQSGGEKAVSTITYLMALQGLSKAPFRVVDEINQGM
jgi:chromosome segregation ATPase